MCGIAGFVDPGFGNREGAEVALGGMLDAIRHRGPDGEGRLVEPEFGLFAGMRRLSIIDLEGGDQPIWNEDHSIAVLFNGEIYNFIELRRELQEKGHCFETHSDTEVLVHLYEEAGEEMLQRLRGMFAFMIFDRRSRSLFFARDHFGQKPFYYCEIGTRIVWGSELKSLLRMPWVPRETDPDALMDYMSWFSLPAPATHWKGVNKLPPGTWMRVPLDRGQDVMRQKYWQWNAKDPALNFSAEEAAAELEAVMRKSIDMHLRSDVPVGVLLSSGLDSKFIGTYAAAAHPGGLSTFTAGYSGEGSEFDGARATAQVMGSTHHEVNICAQDLGTMMGRVARHLDEPIADVAAFAVLRVCEYARQHVKVLLSGEGSDELFAGYAERYSGMLGTLAYSEKWRRFSHLLPRISEAFPKTRWGRLLERAGMTAEGELVGLRREGLPGDVRNPAGLTAAQLQSHREHQRRFGAAMVRQQRDPLHTMLALDIDWQLAESLLLKADKMSMAASIELRTPFLDVEVARFAAQLDRGLKLADGIGKRVVRQCLARTLPEESMSRPKLGFPIPIETWMRGELRDQAESTVFATHAHWKHVLDEKLIREEWNAFLAGGPGMGRVFYALWMYEAWYREATAI